VLRWRSSRWAAAAAIAGLLSQEQPANAESLDEAMAAAYWNNSTLNADRARQRAIDEGVPQALAAFRPTVSAAGNASRTFSGSTQSWSLDAGVNLEQTVFSGFRNINRLRGAEATVQGGRETLRQVEQTVLLDVVTAFMDLVAAQSTLNLLSRALDFYRMQLQLTQTLLESGEVTRVDIALVNTRLAAAQSDYYEARATLTTAIARYGQVVGHVPATLGLARSVDALLPLGADMALAIALVEHPSIVAAEYAVDGADFAVKVAEGALLPSVTVGAGAAHRDGSTLPSPSGGTLSARLTIPIWDGGATASRVRAAKEVLGQRRIELEVVRDQVRQLVLSALGLLEAARDRVRAADARTQAQQRLLTDLLEQRGVGQATTLDVLDAQQDLVLAQIAQVDAQHDRVLYSYSLLSAVGQLSAERLGLDVQIYRPEDHYLLVRNKLHGIRTPDGR
jgi:outer membrane protein